MDTESDIQQMNVPVTGMTCAACERRIAKSLLRMPEVSSVDVSANRGTVIIKGATLPSRELVDKAIRAAGYEPSASSWLTRDPRVWVTFALSALVLALLAWVATASGVTASLMELADPSRGGVAMALVLGLTAGVSTCMALVGGLVLGISASHAARMEAAGRVNPSFLVRMRPHLAFNTGRILGFFILGAALGALGSTMSLPTRLMAVLVLAVALVMALLGLRLTGVSPRTSSWSPRLPSSLGRALGLDSSADGSYSDTRTALVGAATFLLPCGFTQAMQIYALSTANALTAGLVMAVFAVGTTPGLLTLAAVPEVVTGSRRDAVLRVVGVVVLAFAVLNLSSAWNLMGLVSPFASSPSVVASTPAGTAPAVSANVTVADGVQTVHLTQGARGYEPADTVVYAGLPTTWVVDGTAPWDCSAYLRVPSLNVSVDLVEGPNTVDLGTLEAGTIPFTCVMGMYSGNLIAVAAPAPAGPAVPGSS